MSPFDLFIHNTSEVLTCDGPEGADDLTLLGQLSGGAVGITGGAVSWLGAERDVPEDALGPKTQRLDAQGGFVGPGFVDPHTHVVFAGDRSEEFEARCRGKSYLQIAQAGGGIVRTVAATRAASEDELVALALPRLARLLAQGVTTCEVKSGYGLDVENELKMLRAVRRLDEAQPISLIGTLLGLHALPPEFAGDRAGYVRLVRDELLPQVAREGLARFCDAFVEASAFEAADAKDVLERAQALGLAPRLHVDQLTSGQKGAELAASLGAVTADHLEQTTPEGIAALKHSGTVAVLAPISTLFARVRPWAPGRALRDAGVPVALCTNCNPGSSNSESVALAIGLACVENGLTPAEAYLGFTRFAGLALASDTLGRLRVGSPADVAVFACEGYRHLPYQFAVSQLRSVVKSGRVVYESSSPDHVPPVRRSL